MQFTLVLVVEKDFDIPGRLFVGSLGPAMDHSDALLVPFDLCFLGLFSPLAFLLSLLCLGLVDKTPSGSFGVA